MLVPVIVGSSNVVASLIFLVSLQLLLFCLHCFSNVLAVAHITAAVGIPAIAGHAGIINVAIIIFGVATFVF